VASTLFIIATPGQLTFGGSSFTINEGQRAVDQVDSKIDELVKAEIEQRPEQLRHFFERVQSNYDEAIRTASRFLLLMMAAWFLTFAIHMGWITKIDFLGATQLNNDTIVASPFLIGLLTYGQLSALAGAVILWEVVRRGVYHMLPKAWELDLDDWLAPPTFSNVERMLEPKPEAKLQSRFSGAWFVLVSFVIFFGSLAALAQTTYFLFGSQPSHPALGALSAALGLIAWFRGFVLCKSAINATGGFQFRHHRKSRGDEGIPDHHRQDTPPHPNCGNARPNDDADTYYFLRKKKRLKLIRVGQNRYYKG
jgi:hypothetical protein